MSVSVNMHITDGEPLQFNAEAYGERSTFVAATIRVGVGSVSIFMNDIADVDRLAFEFANLSISLREEHGWVAKVND